MKTDKAFYRLFAAQPEFLFELTGMESKSSYTFKSVTIKELSKSMDGLLESDEPTVESYVVEFQGYQDKAVNERLFLQLASLSKDNPDRVYRGMILFETKAHNPKREPWHEIAEKTNAVKVFYWDKLLEYIKRTHPNHILIAALAPFYEDDTDRLAEKAQVYYDQIKNAPLPGTTISHLEEIFIDLLVQRFPQTTVKEFKAMFLSDTPVEQTQIFKELVAIGIKRGEKRGEKRGKLAGELLMLKQLFRDGVISQDEFDKRSAPIQIALKAFNKKKRDITKIEKKDSSQI